PNGQQIELGEKKDVRVDSKGNLGSPGNMQDFGFDQDDPFGLLDASLTQALKAATREGTNDQYYGPTLKKGQSADETYYSPGGDLSASLKFPGSVMKLTVKGPNGLEKSALGAPPVNVLLPGAPEGQYTIRATAIDVGPAGEPYAISVTANPACTATDQPEARNGVIRRVFDPALLEQSLGKSGVTLHIDISGVGNGVLL